MAKRYKKAFTLIELLVVISIIGLLSTIAVVNLQSSRAKATIAAGQQQDTSIYHAVGDQMIGEWLFNEGSGTAASDTSGNNFSGTISGATWTTGESGNALSFVTGNYVALGSSPALDPSNFTITAWIKPGDFSATGGYGYIFSNARDCCGAYNGIEFRVVSNQLLAGIWNGSCAYLWSKGMISDHPVWTFVAFSYNGSKMALYVNGHLDNVVNSVNGVGSPASYPTYIAGMGMAPGSYGIVGSIDQVRLYGSAIVAANIEKLYLAERDKYMAKK